MSTINLPDSPTVGDVHTVGNRSWSWTGSIWESVGTTGPTGEPGVVAATAPVTYDAGAKTVGIDLSAYDTSTEVDTKLSGYDTTVDVDAKLLGYDTSSEVTDKINAIVDAAPGTLDTLNELAAALGNDENFSTTVTEAISNRALLTATMVNKTAAYTLSISDRGRIVTASGTFAITVPSGTFSAGDRVDFINTGSGVITFAGSGVTVNSADGAVTIDTQYSGATILFGSPTLAYLIGAIA
jgi:hypothetical protein